MKQDFRTLKNSVAEHALVHRRLLLALVLVFICFTILFSQFYRLQIIHHEKYQTQSHENRVHLQRLAPQRGLIFDREGRLLAENRPSYMLVVYRDQIKELEPTIDGLVTIGVIDEQEKEAFYQRANNYRKFEAVPVRLNLSERAMARFVAHKYKFDGIEVQATLMRHYPQAELLAHMLGYISRINSKEREMVDSENYSATEYYGKIGVERFYETELHGEVGYEYVETNARGKVLRSLDKIPPVPGKNITLHLDLTLQQTAYDLLGEHRGAIVALDAKTGGVLAAVSKPSYNPNWFAQRITHAQYDALRDDIDLPLFNRVLQAQYPPGSTIKPFVGLAGLEERVVTMQSKVYDPGWYQITDDERFYRDWKREGHGFVDFIHAMEQSCDVYYYDLAFKLGILPMHQFLDRFGFGKATGIDIYSERVGINPSPEWKRSQNRGRWFTGDSLNMGIGQGFMLATPMQLAFATNIIANRGRVLVPQMVAEVGNTIFPIKESESVKLKNETNWHNVILSMQGVVHSWRGTGFRLSQGLTYKMAGKSGTAQVVGIAQGEKYDASQVAIRKRDHALFVAFAPVENPLITVAVVVENGESGSAVAGRMARDVIDTWIQKQGASQ